MKFRIIIRHESGSIDMPPLSPTAAVNRDREAALALYRELAKALNRAGVPIDSDGRVWEQERLMR